MPVINFPAERLKAALGKAAETVDLEEKLAMFGCVPEEVSGEAWAVEVFPDRPDLLSPELLGRSLRAYLGEQPGLTSYELAPPGGTVRVEASVARVRPVIVAGAAYGVELDDAAVKGLMDLQEDLHWGLGARRRKVSVGVHDASGIEAPFTYKAVDPDTVSFVPLRDTRELTMREMVVELEKGEEYAHLVDKHDAWPLIVDANDEVLSFPPIINGTRTTLTPETTDLLVDVTGTDERACRQVLNIVMVQLAELGGSLEQVTIEHPDGSFAVPELEPASWTLSASDAQRLLGVPLDGDRAADALARMGHGVAVDGDQLHVEVPAWRSDVLHEVDLIEDVAIGLGYDQFAGTDPAAVTFGTPSPTEVFAGQLRRAMTGLGYLEAITLTLRSREEQMEAFGAEDPVVAVQNPVSSEQAVLRTRLLPGLIDLAARNTHRDTPQRLFEVGDVVGPSADGKRPRNRTRIAGLVVAHDANFTGIKSHVEGLLRALGVQAREQAAQAPGFQAGRCALLEHREEEWALGFYGEIAPATLEAFELAMPCAGFELELVHPAQAATWSPAEETDRAPGPQRA